MIRVSSEELKPGMIVARSILDGGSSVKLAAGFVLDEAVIKRCRNTGMRHLWVHLEGEDVLPDCNVNDQLALQAQQAWKDNMDMLGKISDVQDSTLENLSRFTADTSRFKDIVASSQVKSVVDRIISSILGQEPLILNLASLRTKEGYLYQHALDVAITSVMVAHKLKFSTPDIQEAALGCFLMDMGMIIVPKPILDKTGDLTPKEAHLMREHPAVGFAILRANEGLSINSAHVAYQHHENLDGSGYPRQIKGSNDFPQKTLSDGGGDIHRYALVAAVCDAYNSAVSPRPGVAPLSPLDAIKHLINSAGSRFNSHVVNALISLIPVYPVGTRVSITKAPKPMLVGYSGVVSKANPNETEKPQVLLLFDRYRRKTKPMLVDMAEDKGFEIQFQHL